MEKIKTSPDHPSDMGARAKKQHDNSGANSGADSHTKLDKGTHFNPHAFGAHNDGTGGAKETAGKVDVRNESRGGKPKGSW
jgi:hypothetical protein